jgi:membrane-bound ClpP family serine protease
MLILLLRRLSPRSRAAAGLVLMVIGLALVGVSLAGVASLLIHGAITVVIGAVLLVSSWLSWHRERSAHSDASHSARQRAAL